MNPVFLKFFLCCLLIYGLLDANSATEAARETGFATIVLWTLIGGIALLWFAAVLAVLRFLWRRGLVRVIYTPLVTLTLFVFAASATRLVLNGFPHWQSLLEAAWIDGLVRDMIVIIVMDILFGSFVAPMHPVFLPHPSGKPEGNEPLSATVMAAGIETGPATSLPEPGVEHPAANDTAVRIGAEDIFPAELVYIRAEDHYLRVVTTRRRILTRGRLSDALAQLDFRLGIQVNRSTWVAFSAIEGVEDDSKGIQTLTLTGGETERVAQSRRIAFQTAMTGWAAATGTV
ncbi:LytTR family DNA-binding domain-containing protein [Paragemmobacter straminiformis]|uniref:LytTR family DNA-binding domain-containing protein n=1 Tax=Paragemmobacter straminiformis TaxID=2045119 RepID=UPI00163A271E|nr:LytTR family DNA-binding domain-containing protein [Gemmobacter straminiformis]